MSLTGGLIPLGKKAADTKARPSYDFDDDDDIDGLLGDSRDSNSGKGTSSKPFKPSVGASSSSRKSSANAQQRRQRSQFSKPRFGGDISDSFESLPSPPPPPGGGTNRDRDHKQALHNSFDDDALSQVSSGAPSPTLAGGKPPGTTYYDTYQKKEYNPLADISATSADLEDSILGGLLGGGNKKKSSTSSSKSAAKPLGSVPPVASTTSNVTKSTGRATLDKQENSLGSSSEKVPSIISPKAANKLQLSSPVNASGHNNSFDDSTETSPTAGRKSFSSKSKQAAVFTFNPTEVSRTTTVSGNNNEDSTDFDNFDLLPNSEIAAISTHSRPPTGKASGGEARSRSVSRSPEPQSSANHLHRNDGNESSSPSEPTRNYNNSGSSSSAAGIAHKPLASDDGDAGGFLPSFLDPERRSRQRRNIGGGRQQLKVSAGDSLDELDKALGLAPASDNGGKQKAVDPFSNVSPRFTPLSAGSGGSGRAAFATTSTIDSDDSDADPFPTSATATTTTTTAVTSGMGKTTRPHGADAVDQQQQHQSQTSGFPSLPATMSGRTQLQQQQQLSETEYNDSNKRLSIKKSVTVSIPNDSDAAASGAMAPQSVTSQGRKSSISKSSHFADDLPGVGGQQSSSTNDPIAASLSVQVTQSMDFTASMSSPGDNSNANHNNRRNTPAWLSSPGTNTPSNINNPSAIVNPSGAGTTSASSGVGGGTSAGGVLRSPAGLGGNNDPQQQSNFARTLQTKLEETTLEKEAVERQLRLEIDSLKYKLANSFSNNYSHNGQGRLPGEHEAKEGLSGSPDTHHWSGSAGSESTFDRFAKERAEFNNIIRHMESEIARLKDDAIVQALRHKEEISYLNSKFVSDTKDLKSRHSEDIRSLESRHIDTVNALKALHAEEIKGIRERSKDKILLEQLSGQITNTSGSIKFIEEQLNARHRSLDAVREGQIEARERLLDELEDQAKQRVESAETEAYKLKGLLIHMEQMMTNIKQQSVEEKIRLQQENERMMSLQLSMDSERKAMHGRMDDELQMVKSKMRELDTQQRQLQADRRAHNDTILEANEKLERSKSEFKKLVEENAKAMEMSTRKLKDEESRLQTTRHELTKEAQQVNEIRSGLKKELRESQEYKAQLDQLQMELQSEKIMVQDTARQLQQMSEDFNRQYDEIERKNQSLVEREEILQRGLQEMNQASSSLMKKEQELLSLKQMLENRQVSLEQQAQEIDRLHVVRLGQHRQQLAAYTASSQTVVPAPSHYGLQSALQVQPPPPVKSFSPQKKSAQRSHLFSSNSGARQSEADRLEQMMQEYVPDSWINNFKQTLADSAGAKVLMLKEQQEALGGLPLGQSRSAAQGSTASGKQSWSANYLRAQSASQQNQIDPVVAELRGARQALLDSKISLKTTSAYSLERENFISQETAAMDRLRDMRR